MKRQTNKWLVIIGCLLLVGVVVFGCAPSPAETTKPGGVPPGYEKLQLAGGSVGSVGSITRIVESTILNRYYPEIEWSARSGSSTINIRQLQEGTIKIGLLDPPAYPDVYPQDPTGAQSRLRTIHIHMPLTNLIILVPADKPWKTLADVPRGAVYNPGTPGSATGLMGKIYQEAAGLPADYFKLLPLGKGESATAWRDGKLDAFFANVESATPWLIDMFNSPRKPKAIGMTPEQAAKSAKQWESRYCQLPSKTNLSELLPEFFRPEDEVLAPKAWYGLGVRDDFPEEMAYKIIKVFDEHHSELTAMFSGFKLATLEYTVKNVGQPAPLHPGVVKYAREKGYMK